MPVSRKVYRYIEIYVIHYAHKEFAVKTNIKTCKSCSHIKKYIKLNVSILLQGYNQAVVNVSLLLQEYNQAVVNVSILLQVYNQAVVCIKHSKPIPVVPQISETRVCTLLMWDGVL